MARKNHKSEGTPGGNGREQTFYFKAPGAMSVQLVGDFTHWQEKPISMQKAADGSWRANVELTAGTHRYRFLVDGEWRDDPECHLHIANPYGSQDAVCQVP